MRLRVNDGDVFADDKIESLIALAEKKVKKNVDEAAVLTKNNCKEADKSGVNKQGNDRTNGGVKEVTPIPWPNNKWPVNVSVMPTELTRAGLFILLPKRERKGLKDQVLESRGDTKITYTGYELDQGDCDVWLACLRFGKTKSIGEQILVTAAHFLREIGRTDTGPNREWLVNSIKRLSKASIEVEMSRGKKRINIITGFLKYVGIQNEKGHYLGIRLDPDGKQLFENIAYLDWGTRLKLRSKSAKAIHLYVCGHQAGKRHTVSVDALRKWIGYQGRIRQFRSDVMMPALCELQKNGVLETGPISIQQTTSGEIVSWVRTKR